MRLEDFARAAGMTRHHSMTSSGSASPLTRTSTRLHVESTHVPPTLGNRISESVTIACGRQQRGNRLMCLSNSQVETSATDVRLLFWLTGEFAVAIGFRVFSRLTSAQRERTHDSAVRPGACHQ